jgi:peptidoglycan/LPS O-acetylase OafA/YrhL
MSNKKKHQINHILDNFRRSERDELSGKNTVSHDNNFNFLRVLLSTLVLLSHSSELIDGDRRREILTNIFHTISFGELAVDGFFLLSGYLIVQSWQRKPRFLDFMKKRILRIYPGFIVASLFCLFIEAPLGRQPIDFFATVNVSDTIEDLSRIFWLNAPIAVNIFPDSYYPTLNGAMWTILHEFRCYVLVAVLGAIGALKKERIWLIFSMIVLAISIIPAAAITASIPRLPLILVEHSLDLMRLLTFFCVGGCFYLLRERISYNQKLIPIFMLIIIASLFNSILLKLILPIFGGYVLLWVAFFKLPILNFFKTASDLSYGVYLYGWPVQKLLLWYVPSLSPWLLFIMSAIVSVGCGLLSWHLVEKPCLRLKSS